MIPVPWGVDSRGQGRGKTRS